MKIRIIKKIEEAAQGFEDVRELKEYKVQIKEKSGYYDIFFLKNEEVDGEFNLDTTSKSCGYVVTHSYVENSDSAKYGPFGYDLLIELGTLLGYWVAPSYNPSGTLNNKPTKGEDAIFVWIYYDNKRSDLRKKQIPECGDDKGRAKTLSSFKTMYRMPEETKETHRSAITKMYQKDPLFLSKLKTAGMLEAPQAVMDMIPGEEKKGAYQKIKNYFSKFFN